MLLGSPSMVVGTSLAGPCQSGLLLPKPAPALSPGPWPWLCWPQACQAVGAVLVALVAQAPVSTDSPQTNAACPLSAGFESQQTWWVASWHDVPCPQTALTLRTCSWGTHAGTHLRNTQTGCPSQASLIFFLLLLA